MNKTISISIDNKKFDLNEDAFLLLEEYLEGIKKHFSSHPDQKEIVGDIENSIAEKFTEKLSKHKQVITKTDVKDLIKNMGTIEDFEKFEEEVGEKEGEKDLSKKTIPTETIPTATVTKKLYRDPDNKILGGVASGMAAYFNIDPTLVRLAFVLTTIFWGFGLLLYLILWLIVPEAKSTAQKIEMYGGQANLATIKMKASSPINEGSLETRRRIQKIFGLLLIIFSSLVLLFVASFLTSFMLSGMIPSLLFLFLGVFLLAPFLLLLYLGINLVKNKETSRKVIVFLMIGLLVAVFSSLYMSGAIRSAFQYFYLGGYYY